MNEIYYIVENGVSKGPYSIEALRLMGIGRDTFIWRQGMQDWAKAGDLQEIEAVFQPADSAFGDYAREEPAVYFAMFGEQRVGPESIENLMARGLNEETPVWRNGMADWLPASSQPEIMSVLRAARSSNFTGGMPGIPPARPYSPGPVNTPQQFYPIPHTNWMVWAIIATILGFLCSCLGGIFGIVGIVKASQANNFYARGDEYNGQQSNNSAQVWTIIALVLGGIGFLLAVFNLSVLSSLADALTY